MSYNITDHWSLNVTYDILITKWCSNKNKNDRLNNDISIYDQICN